MNPKTVLYADDDEDDRDMLHLAFESHKDYHLISFPDGEGLLQYLDEHGPNVCLIVLDINMPKLGGIQVLQSMKSNPKYAAIPAVMFTTGVNSPQAKQLILQDIIGVVEKPSTYKEIEHIALKLLQYC